MRFASLFAGIGGFDLGLEMAGMEGVFQCEIDAQCREVLERHWPGVRRHDDIRTLKGAEIGGVDLICGGFPCQDLSVAGKRAGLAGARSGLWFEMLRVIDEARPRWVVWENVPGLISSWSEVPETRSTREMGGGRRRDTWTEESDFSLVLESLAEIGYFGAWRILDSQWFGVGQRRRRVFGVFAQGSTGCDRAPAVLLEREGGGWHPKAGGGAEEGTAARPGKRTKGDRKGRPLYYSHDYNQDRIYPTDGPSPACAARDSGGARNVFVPERAYTLAAAPSQRRNSEVSDTFVAMPVKSGDKQDESHQTYIPETAYCLREDPGGIGQGHNTTYVSGPIDGWGGGACPERTQQLVASSPDDAAGARTFAGLPVGMDTRRYRQLGNAVTVNVAYWIGLRIMTISGGA